MDGFDVRGGDGLDGEWKVEKSEKMVEESGASRRRTLCAYVPLYILSCEVVNEELPRGAGELKEDEFLDTGRNWWL